MLDLNTGIGVNSVGQGGEASFFTTLSAASGMYYSIPSITLSGEFEIEVEIALDDLVDEWLLSHSSDPANNRIGLNASSAFVIEMNNVLRNFGTVTSDMSAGELSTVVITRDSSDNVTPYINGVSLGAQTLGEDFSIDAVGSWFGSFYTSGIIRNLKIWTGGDRTTGTLARYYPINERTGTVVRDLANGQDGSTVNITDNERELFIYQPWVPQWVSQDGLTVIEVA